MDFYDGSESEVDSFSQFEGVYRMNQGIDYAYQNEAFDVLAIFSGSVEEVKEDAMFGHTVKVKSDDLTITYQSLSAPTLQEGDAIKQGDVIAQAGVNIYGKDLGNHVHIVVSKGDRLIDPESIYGLAVKDIQ